jgi:hypothetical protein
MLCWDATTAHGGSAYQTQNDRLFFHVVHRKMCIAKDKIVMDTAEDPKNAEQDIVYSDECKCGDHPVPDETIDLHGDTLPTPPHTPKKVKPIPSTKSCASPEGLTHHDFLERQNFEMHVDDGEFDDLDSDNPDYDASRDAAPDNGDFDHSEYIYNMYGASPSEHDEEEGSEYVPDRDTTLDGDERDSGKEELFEWTYAGLSGDEALPQRAVLPSKGIHAIFGHGTIESRTYDGRYFNFRVVGQETVQKLGTQHIQVDNVSVKDPQARTVVGVKPSSSSSSSSSSKEPCSSCRKTKQDLEPYQRRCVGCQGGLCRRKPCSVYMPATKEYFCQVCNGTQPPWVQTQASGAQEKKTKEKKKQVNEEAEPFGDNFYCDSWHDNYQHPDPELYPDVYDAIDDSDDCGELTAEEDGFVYDPNDYGRFPDNFDDSDAKRAQVQKRRQKKKKAIVLDEVEEPEKWKNMPPPKWENPKKVGLRKFVPEWWKPDLRKERTPNEDPEYSTPKGFEWYTPLDLFLLYIPLHLFYTIADMTNLRFEQKAPKDDDPKKAEKENYRKRWYPCTATTVLRFVGLMVLFTPCK